MYTHVYIYIYIAYNPSSPANKIPKFLMSNHPPIFQASGWTSASCFREDTNCRCKSLRRSLARSPAWLRTAWDDSIVA